MAMKLVRLRVLWPDGGDGELAFWPTRLRCLTSKAGDVRVTIAEVGQWSVLDATIDEVEQALFQAMGGEEA